MRQADLLPLQEQLHQLQQIETAQFAEIVQLQDSADCWKSICHYAPLVFVSVNAQGIINTLSQGDTLFFSGEVSCGNSNIFDCFVSPHVEELKQALQRSFDSAQQQRCLLHLSLDDRWLEIAIMPILASTDSHAEAKSDAGNPRFDECLLRLQDISDRQLARSQLADAHWQLSQRCIAKEQARQQQDTLQLLYTELESLTRLGVWEQDLLTGEYTLSDQLYQLFGIDAQQRINDATMLGVIDAAQRQQFSRCLKDALKLHLNFDQVFDVINSKKQHFSARFRGRPSVEGNYTTRLTGTVQDVSEEQQLQQQLRQAKQQIEILTQTKSHFISNLSHEVLNPMQAIYETAMALHYDEPELRQYVEIIRQCSAQLLALLGNILDYSKIESGHLELQSSNLDLAALLLKEVDKVRDLASEKGLHIECEFDQTLPSNLIGDKQRIAEVIANILDNAIKFTENGGIKISVEAQTIKAQQCECLISIKDSGIGIDKDKRDAVFEKFYQADSSHSRQVQGVGLGLTIAQHLVTAMQGKLWVKSAKDEGSNFCIQLPLSISNSADNSDTLPNRNYLKQVLLCDYDPLSQQKIRHTLLQVGITTWAVNCKQEFEEALQSQDYDLVMLDCNLPDLEHMSALHQHSNVATMSITDHFDRRLVADCIAAGSEAVFAKPLQTPALICELDRLFLH